MKKIFIPILSVFLFAAGCTIQNQPNPSINNQNSSCKQITLGQNTDYVNAYNQIDSQEKTITGTLKANSKQSQPSTLMRNLTYNVDGVNLYSLANLDSYIGKKVTIEGKLNKFELEGQNLTEIWPSTMCIQN